MALHLYAKGWEACIFQMYADILLLDGDIIYWQEEWPNISMKKQNTECRKNFNIMIEMIRML